MCQKLIFDKRRVVRLSFSCHFAGSYNPNMPMQGGPPQQPPPVQQPPAAQHPGQQPAQQPPPQQHPGQPFPVAAPPAADYNAYNMQSKYFTIWFRF